MNDGSVCDGCKKTGFTWDRYTHDGRPRWQAVRLVDGSSVVTCPAGVRLVFPMLTRIAQ